MLIETQRLLIRDLKLEDGISFAKMASDGSLNDIGFDKSCGSWMSDWITEAKELTIGDNPNTDYLAYAVTLKEDDTVVGSVGCSFYEDFEETGITYFIGAQYRNKGYAVEAVKAYVEHFFDHYDVKKLIATIRAENISSCKVAEKAGFRLTGIKMYKDLNDDKEELYCFYDIMR